MKASFADKLMHWHAGNKRDLPWKRTSDPYSVWLSEIILQQTRVDQGLPYYIKFISKYPTIKDLAAAKEDDVLKSWEGLGYYTRARNLHYAAKQVTSEYGGKFPDTYNELKKLKGVGSYSAAAIASFAYNLPHSVVDGNVIRVISRYFGITVPVDTTSGKKLLTEIASNQLYKAKPGDYNQAIMDFGATVCKPSNPQCGSCPLKKQCYALKHDVVHILPIKSKKAKTTRRWFNFLVIDHTGEIILEKRNGDDIWKGLYQFPLIETKSSKKMTALNKMIKEKKIFRGIKWKIRKVSGAMQQKLTHQVIFAQFVSIELKGEKVRGQKSWKYVKKKNLNQYGFPKVIRNYLNQNGQTYNY